MPAQHTITMQASRMSHFSLRTSTSLSNLKIRKLPSDLSPFKGISKSNNIHLTKIKNPVSFAKNSSVLLNGDSFEGFGFTDHVTDFRRCGIVGISRCGTCGEIAHSNDVITYCCSSRARFLFEKLTDQLHYVCDAIDFIAQGMQEMVGGRSNLAQITLMKTPIERMNFIWRLTVGLEMKGLVGDYDRILCIVDNMQSYETMIDEFSDIAWFVEEKDFCRVLEDNPLLKNFKVIIVQNPISESATLQNLVKFRSDLKVVAPYQDEEQKSALEDTFAGLTIGDFYGEF